MAIVPVSKVTLYGVADQKKAVLEGLQNLGCTHLVNLTPGTGDGHPVPAYSVEAHEALKYLETCPTQRRPKTDRNGFDFAAVEREALEIRRRERELNDERDFVVRAIETVRPWGDFHLPAEEETGGLRFWFYVVPHRRMEEVRASGLVWQAVARDERFNYVVVIQADKPENMPVAPEDLGSHSLSQLKRRSREIEQELDKLQSRREELTRQTLLFKQTMLEADDRATLDHAGKQTLDESRVFAVQGWAPRKEVPHVESFAKERGLAVFVEGPGPKDEPPTLLTNPEPLAGGEATVTFYMTPAYHTWDPSIIVFFSFAIFFGMIFSDAGYGLLLGAVLIFWWRSLGKNRTGVRLRNLFLALVLASVGYGVLVGSYFGWSPAEGTLLGSLQVLNVNDQGRMMHLTIIIGAAHLILANLRIAWLHWGSPRFFAPIGWSAMILGGLLAGTSIVRGESLGAGETTLLALGAGAVVFFSSARPFVFAGVGDVVLRLVDGLLSLTSVSKAFGDVLSYLRLFALGLASSLLATTFNEIAGGMMKYRGVGLLVAILILVVGHGLNFVLAIIGGVVHGLRLNCIEFFNWCLPDEGYPFQPFCKKASQ